MFLEQCWISIEWHWLVNKFHVNWSHNYNMNLITKVYSDVSIPERLEIAMCRGSCVWACVEASSYEYETSAGFAWMLICVPHHSNTTKSCLLSLEHSQHLCTRVLKRHEMYPSSSLCFQMPAFSLSLSSVDCSVIHTSLRDSLFWEASHALLVSPFFPSADTAPWSQIPIVSPEARSPIHGGHGYISCFSF